MGMTTTAVAMNHALVEGLGARIVVIEEAAEVGPVGETDAVVFRAYRLRCVYPVSNSTQHAFGVSTVTAVIAQ